MNEREEFEKWYGERYSHYAAKQKYPDGSYSVFATQLAWNTWQACAALKDKRIVELEAELAEQAKVLVANVDKQLALEAANKDLQAWFDNVKADYDALKARLEDTETQDGFCVTQTLELMTTFAELVQKEAYMKIAKDYRKVENDRFTGADVAIWCECEADVIDVASCNAREQLQELSDEEIVSTFEAAVKASPEYTEDDGDIPDDVRALVITFTRKILAKARGE